MLSIDENKKLLEIKEEMADAIHKKGGDLQFKIAALLSDALKLKNMTVVLVGGSAVEFYTFSEYTTKDIDMILRGEDRDDLFEIMTFLEFEKRSGMRHFIHERLDFPIEFPPGPLQVASRFIEKVAEVKIDRHMLKVIKIEDLILDRICAAVEWKDKNSFRQAELLILKNKHHINWKYLEDFSKKEGYLKEFKQLKLL